MPNTRRIRHKGYKNSETRRVQKRIESVIEPHRARIANSLAVESLHCIVYKRTKIGTPCSCSMVEVDADDPTMIVNADAVEAVREAVPVKAERDRSVRPLNGGLMGFGAEGGSVLDETRFESSFREIELGTLMPPTRDMQEQPAAPDVTGMYEELALGGNIVNCPICYREGYVPAFQPVGYNYQTLTPLNVDYYEGYRIDIEALPNCFIKMADDAYCDFLITVPKFYRKGTWSIRTHENELLPANEIPVIVVGNRELPLTNFELNAFRGNKCRVRVRTQRFSHLIFVFDMGANEVKCNISEETQMLDYDKELTVANLSIVLPWNMGNIQPQDILVLPSRNYVLMVTDAPQKRNAQNQTWEWVVQTRTIQRKERVFNIHNGNVIR